MPNVGIFMPAFENIVEGIELGAEKLKFEVEVNAEFRFPKSEEDPNIEVVGPAVENDIFDVVLLTSTDSVEVGFSTDGIPLNIGCTAIF